MEFLTDSCESASLFDVAPALNDDPFWTTLSTAANSPSASPLYEDDFESFNVESMLGDDMMEFNLNHFELSVQPTRPASPAVMGGFLDMPLVPSPAPSVASLVTSQQSQQQQELAFTLSASAAPMLAPAVKRRAVHMTINTDEYEMESVSSGRTGEDEFVEVEEDADIPAPRPTKKRSRDSATDSESKRNTHNILERKRRDELKGSFDELRECIPSLADDQRAPKVTILCHACDYITLLGRESSRIAREKEKAEAERQRLLARLATLKNMK